MRLRRLVRRLVSVRRQIERLEGGGGGAGGAFLTQQAERLERVQRVVLMDLAAALRMARGAGTKTKKKGGAAVVRILGLYAEMDAGREAMKVVREGAGGT